ncbi:alpha/beta fold hydrolase [Lapillicoccus jejuensis]|uniref:Alpha-beta hydrolase superfamily lysophospholipase n=1 Tax=Lapillicoccus jejuensis TaxID=402171 RepID=A0A542E021_9MICO|nr:alpha/beta hydrolase [Lapillicoccus jejuensis]TQJ08711.1 alpha-beta hydrolase superfamily lysophospholipase [Lapillicoccus jejuensis]
MSARELTVLADDGALLAVQVHDPADGPDDEVTTLVLAHGWTLSHRTWDPVVAGLAGRPGLRVVTWDQRGHGRSTLARGRRRPRGVSVRRLAADLRTVVDATAPEGPLVLAGHSMGGMTVMALAGRDPGLVTRRVRGVALVATSAGGLAEGTRPAQRWGARLAAHAPAVPLGRTITLQGQRALLFGEHADPGAVAATRDQVAATRLASFGGFYGALMAHDEVASLAVLADVPVTVLVGTRDRLTPERHARALVAALPHARLEVLDGAGHMLPYEATGEVTAAIADLLVPVSSGG